MESVATAIVLHDIKNVVTGLHGSEAAEGDIFLF